LAVAALLLPIEPAIHPEADLIEEQVTAWLDRCGTYASELERAWLLAINGAELMARVYPNGMAERVALSAEWYLWALVRKCMTRPFAP